MILRGQLLIDDDEGFCRLQPGSIRLQGERIAEITYDDPGERHPADTACLITPGLIDAHLHLPQFEIIGAHGMPLLAWLEQITFPAEQAWSDIDTALSQVERALEQLLACGTTGIAAFATVHHEPARAALRMAEQFGIRAKIGQVLMDQFAPPALCRPAQQMLDEANRLSEEFPAASRVAAAVSPRFALSCSETLLAGAGKLAAEHQATVQTHLAETSAECDEVRRRFGRSYVEVYRDTGLTTAMALMGHGIHLDARDREVLAATRSTIVHCPTANTFLHSGSMDWAGLRQAKVPIALGSDIGAGYERSMIRVAREMILTAARRGDTPPTAPQAWYAITRGNADALGWADAGRIRVGAMADLLVIRPTIEWIGTGTEPLSKLMFQWDDRWLHQILLRGQVVERKL